MNNTKNTLTCPTCDYTLHGDEPEIVTVCEVCKLANQVAIVVTYTEGDYEFKIKGKDYKEVLSKLCNFLNGDLDFPYTFTVKQNEQGMGCLDTNERG